MKSHWALKRIGCALPAVVCACALAQQPFVHNVRYSPVQFPGVTTRSVVACPRTAHAPTIDGRLDDRAWQHALLVKDFYQLSGSGRGAAATVRTHAYLAYDDQNLYVAAVCFDTKTKDYKTAYHLKKVDWYNSIELFLDTNADAKSYYQVVIDWRAQVWSAYYQAQGQADKSWEVKATARVTRSQEAWTLEAALPLSSFADVTTLDSRTWGVNIGRNQKTEPGETNTSWCGVYHGPGLYQRVVFTPPGRVIPSELSMGEGTVGRNRVRGRVLNPSGQRVTVNAALELFVGDGVWKPIPGGKTVNIAAGSEAEFELEYDVPLDWAPPHAKEPKKLLRVAFRDPGTSRHMGGTTAWIITPPVLRLRTDRERYHFHDTNGQGVLNINVGRDTLPNAQVRVSLIPDAGRAATRELVLAAPRDREAALYVALKDVEPGEYRLSATLSVHGRKMGTSEVKLRKAPGQPREATKARIPLVVQPLTAPDAWPVTTGVPFPNGVLRDGDHVRLLDPQGREVLIQVATTARWSPLGFVRWLMLDFPARTDPVQALSYQLEYGKAVRHTKVVSPLTVDQREDAITVTTGPLRFRVNRKRYRFLEQASLDVNGNGQFEPQEAVLQPGKQSGSYLVDHKRRRYESGNTDADSVVVEESGPQRAVVRAEGWQTAADGTQLGRYVTRIHAYAGKPFIRVFHTFIITADSRKVRYRNIALASQLAQVERTAVGIDGGKACEGKTALSLVQDAWDHCVVRGVDPPVEGKHGDGWVRVDGKQTGLTVQVRDFWQNYPKELEVADGRLVVHFWPAHNRPRKHTLADTDLDNVHMLYFAHEGEALDFRIPPDYQTKFNKSNECYYVETATKCANAMGVAKTHEMLYLFHPADADPASLRTTGSAFQTGLACLAAPEWVCATEAIDGSMPMHPHDPDRFPEMEWALSAMFDWQQRAQEHTHDYGMWFSGDGHDTWLPETKCWRVHRTWINTHHGSPRVPWLLYARSGDSKYLTAARRKAYRCLDLGFCHYSTPELEALAYPAQKIKGALTDYKGLVPWSAGGRLFDYNCMTDFMLYAFYLTGDRRGLDVMQEWVDAVIERFRRPTAHRTGSGVLASALMAYQHTWDHRLLEIIERYVNAKLASQGEDGSIPGWSQYAPWLSRLHQFTGRPDAEQCLARWCDWHLRRLEQAPRPYERHFWPMAYGYRVFKREEYLSAKASFVRLMLDSMYRVPGDFYDGFWSPATSYRNGYLSQEVPFFLHALTAHGKSVQPIYARCQVFNLRRGTYRLIALDEDDRPIRFATNMRTPETQFRLTAPDGSVIKEGTIAAPKGEEFAVSVPTDGQKGEYVLTLEVKASLAMQYPVSDLAKEVLDTGYNPVTPVYGHRLCFFVPKGTSDARLDIERTAQPRGFCLYDGDDRAVLRLYWHDTQRRVVPVAFQPRPEQCDHVWAMHLGQKTKRTRLALHKPLLPFISLRREQFFVSQTGME